jgi:hypothetical protein
VKVFSLSALGLAALLGGCAGAPVPEWQSEAHISLEKFRQNYLEGNTRLAERHFAEARMSISATGRLDLAARAELIRCALATASLSDEPCAQFEALRNFATEEEKAYAQFLAGRWQDLRARDLPEPYRGVVTAGSEASQNRAIGRIEDPVSRLVAAGAAFRAGRLSPAGVATAIDTASAQGFRRPLLAYLNVQAKLAEQAGDTAALETIRRRIELVSQPLPDGR